MKSSLRILHLEDDSLDAELLRGALAAEGLECDVLRVETSDAFVAAIKEGGFDLIISDFSLPSFDGFSALAIAREIRPDLPFIMLSGTLGEEVAVETLKSGATDYVLKQRMPRIAPSVTRALREAEVRRERKRAEENLEVQQTLLRKVIDTNPNLIFVKDQEGKFTLVNKAAADIYGTTVEGLCGKGDADFNRIQEEVDSFARADREVIETLRPKFVPEEPISDARTGEVRWFQTLKVPLVGPINSERYVLGVATDITERKRVEAALRQSEEKYRTLIENIPDVTWWADSEGRITFISANVEEILGFRPEEIYQEPEGFWYDRIHPDDFEEVKRGLSRLFKKSERFDVEYRVQRKDGQWRWLHNRAEATHRDEGPVYAYGVLSDITERKRLEEQLNQAQKMEAVGRLAGGVAHDFNNLLTVITGYSQLLLSRLGQNDKNRQELEEIEKAGKRASSLTSQLLAFSRRQILQPRVIDLNAVISDLGKMLRRLIGEDIDIVTNLSDRAVRVKADPSQLEQILLNLAVNARDAMPMGGKLILETARVDLNAADARSHVDVSPGPYVVLAVSDTGCGMDKQLQSRIFEPFFTTKEKDKGTGLGLSTVYGIVKQSGGNIWLYSEPGTGSTFKIYLPRVEEAADDLEADEPGAKSRGHETILLVEDDEAVRRLTRGILESNGYTVLEAMDGEEALRLTCEHRGNIDALLTDMVMPRMSGKNLARLISVKQPHVRILYLSGYTNEAITQLGALDPGDAFLQKPFTPQLLVNKVREVLDSPIHALSD